MYELISAIVAFESGDYMNLSRFSEVFIRLYDIPE